MSSRKSKATATSSSSKKNNSLSVRRNEKVIDLCDDDDIDDDESDECDDENGIDNCSDNANETEEEEKPMTDAILEELGLKLNTHPPVYKNPIVSAVLRNDMDKFIKANIIGKKEDIQNVWDTFFKTAFNAAGGHLCDLVNRNTLQYFVAKRYGNEFPDFSIPKVDNGDPMILHYTKAGGMFGELEFIRQALIPNLLEEGEEKRCNKDQLIYTSSRIFSGMDHLANLMVIGMLYDVEAYSCSNLAIVDHLLLSFSSRTDTLTTDALDHLWLWRKSIFRFDNFFNHKDLKQAASFHIWQKHIDVRTLNNSQFSPRIARDIISASYFKLTTNDNHQTKAWERFFKSVPITIYQFIHRNSATCSLSPPCKIFVPNITYAFNAQSKPKWHNDIDDKYTNGNTRGRQGRNLVVNEDKENEERDILLEQTRLFHTILDCIGITRIHLGPIVKALVNKFGIGENKDDKNDSDDSEMDDFISKSSDEDDEDVTHDGDEDEDEDNEDLTQGDSSPVPKSNKSTKRPIRRVKRAPLPSVVTTSMLPKTPDSNKKKYGGKKGDTSYKRPQEAPFFDINLALHTFVDCFSAEALTLGNAFVDICYYGANIMLLLWNGNNFNTKEPPNHYPLETKSTFSKLYKIRGPPVTTIQVGESVVHLSENKTEEDDRSEIGVPDKIQKNKIKLKPIPTKKEVTASPVLSRSPSPKIIKNLKIKHTTSHKTPPSPPPSHMSRSSPSPSKSSHKASSSSSKDNKYNSLSKSERRAAMKREDEEEEARMRKEDDEELRRQLEKGGQDGTSSNEEDDEEDEEEDEDEMDSLISSSDEEMSDDNGKHKRKQQKTKSISSSKRSTSRESPKANPKKRKLIGDGMKKSRVKLERPSSKTDDQLTLSFVEDEPSKKDKKNISPLVPKDLKQVEVATTKNKTLIKDTKVEIELETPHKSKEGGDGNQKTGGLSKLHLSGVQMAQAMAENQEREAQDENGDYPDDQDYNSDEDHYDREEVKRRKKIKYNLNDDEDEEEAEDDSEEEQSVILNELFKDAKPYIGFSKSFYVVPSVLSKALEACIISINNESEKQQKVMADLIDACETDIEIASSIFNYDKLNEEGGPTPSERPMNEVLLAVDALFQRFPSNFNEDGKWVDLYPLIISKSIKINLDNFDRVIECLLKKSVDVVAKTTRNAWKKEMTTADEFYTKIKTNPFFVRLILGIFLVK